MGRHAIPLALGTGLLLAALAPPAMAQAPLPDIDIQVVVQVYDRFEWLAFYEEVLATPRESPRPLSLGIAAGTGGTRWLTVYRPRFATTITGGRNGTVRVTVAGKVLGGDALRSLAAFERALLDLQESGVDPYVGLSYGLAGTTARLLELHLARP